MRLLLEVALALFAGLLMTRVFKYLKLNFPDVTAFLVAGVLVGPFVLGRLGIMLLWGLSLSISETSSGLHSLRRQGKLRP